MKLLIVTAVDAERDAVLAGVGSAHVDVRTVGVGPSAAAAATATLLAHGDYDGVLNAGIAGAITDIPTGCVVVATNSIAGELGVRTDDGFTAIDELGYGSNRILCDSSLTASINGERGDILTLSTVTGSAALAARIKDTYPGAVAEAMEGFGVATAASHVGLPFGEYRAISNAVGDRNTKQWDWRGAFTALSKATEALTS